MASASACQAEGRGFEPHHPLQIAKRASGFASLFCFPFWGTILPHLTIPHLATQRPAKRLRPRLTSSVPITPSFARGDDRTGEKPPSRRIFWAPTAFYWSCGILNQARISLSHPMAVDAWGVTVRGQTVRPHRCCQPFRCCSPFSTDPPPLVGPSPSASEPSPPFYDGGSQPQHERAFGRLRYG